jgi:membrane protease subunit HflC
MRKVSLPTVFTAALVVLVLAVYMVTFVVRFSEVAVKVRLGRVVETIDRPGLYFCWPRPFERIERFDTRLRVLDTVESETKTRDGKNIIVGNYAIWRIRHPRTLVESRLSIREAEDKLRARINQRRAAVIGNEDLSSFVNLNEELVNANYDRIEQEMLTGIQTEGERAGISLRDSVLADFGIELVKVGIRRISLPEETTQSVFQQMIAERQKEAARFREEGKSRAATITAQAEANRNSIMKFAETMAGRIQSTGIQASTGILKQIAAEDAEFFEWLRWLDALRVALRQKSTIFLDSRSDLFRYLQAPLTPEGTIVPAPELPLSSLPSTPEDAHAQP